MHFTLSFKFSEQIEIIRFRVHCNVVNLIFQMKRFQPEPFGFIGTISHPQKTTQNRVFMLGDSKCTMAINPAVGVGLIPSGFFIDTAKPFGDNALFLLLFVPNRPFGLIHHFIGADDIIITQAQEIAEK